MKNEKKISIRGKSLSGQNESPGLFTPDKKSQPCSLFAQGIVETPGKDPVAHFLMDQIVYFQYGSGDSSSSIRRLFRSFPLPKKDADNPEHNIEAESYGSPSTRRLFPVSMRNHSVTRTHFFKLIQYKYKLYRRLQISSIFVAKYKSSVFPVFLVFYLFSSIFLY